MQVSIHVHTAQVPGSVTSLVSIINAKSGEVAKSRPRAILKGQTAVLEVTPDQPLCAERYADFRSLGRLVLRHSGQTLAIGVITSLCS